MAQGSQTLTTYYAKRIIGDNAAASPDKALLQTGIGIESDAWILNQTKRYNNNTSQTYGIKYIYDGTNDNDAIEFYGNKKKNNVLKPSVTIYLNSGNTEIDGTLDVAGATVLASTLEVTGTTTLSSTLEVGSTSLFKNNVTIETSTSPTLTLESTASSAVDWDIKNNSGIFTIIDKAGSSNKKLIGNHSKGWEIYNKLYINTAIPDSGTLHNLQVNGSSYFDGSATHTGYVYFADGTTYYIDNSGNANLNAITANGTVRLNVAKDSGYIYIRGNTNTKDMGYFGLIRSSTDEGDLYYDTRWRVLYYSYDSTTKARLDTYEQYNLPTVDEDLAENQAYKFLTTKNTVTTGQGGTGVTSHTANRLVWSTSATTIQAGYHYANTTKVAINSTSEPSYNLYVNGTSYFNGNTTHNGIDYFANGTTYYINNSGTANLYGLTANSSAYFKSYAIMQAQLRINNSKTDCIQYYMFNNNDNYSGYFGLVRGNPGDGNLYKDNIFRFLIWSYNSSTKARIDKYEYYDLPAVTADRTGNASYSIRTSKDNNYTVSNATTATQLSSNAGGTEQPIYFTGGKPSATSYALKATVNNGTATRLAYYSAARAISSGSIVTDGSYLRNIGGYSNASYALTTASFICNSWIRTVGSTGWFNETHSGGIYMTDDTYVRVYNGKNFYVSNTTDNAIYTAGGVTACAANGLRIAYGSKSFIIRDDGSNTYFMPCTNGNATGNNWASFYSYVGMADGYWHFVRAYGAVWNDYAEYRAANTIEPGRVVQDTNSGEMQLVNKRLAPGCKIISDTYGFAIGETKEAKTPIAVSGRVLVYPYKERKQYNIGDAVCSAPNGTVDIMTREEIMMYPERILGTVSEIPEYTEWKQTAPNPAGGEEAYTQIVQVKGRIWVYVK